MPLARAYVIFLFLQAVGFYWFVLGVLRAAGQWRHTEWGLAVAVLAGCNRCSFRRRIRAAVTFYRFGIAWTNVATISILSGDRLCATAFIAAPSGLSLVR